MSVHWSEVSILQPAAAEIRQDEKKDSDGTVLKAKFSLNGMEPQNRLAVTPALAEVIE